MNRRISLLPRGPWPGKRGGWGAGLLLALLASSLLAPEASAAFYGHATVLSGDTLEIAGTRVRLRGVSAPGLDQRCRRADGIEWRCGLLARRALENRIASRPLHCATHPPGPSAPPLAICRTEGAALGAWMVGQGWALATDDRYAGVQEAARSAGRGLWRDGFEPSGEWRRLAGLPYRPGEEGDLDGCACAARHGSLQRRSSPEAAAGD